MRRDYARFPEPVKNFSEALPAPNPEKSEEAKDAGRSRGRKEAWEAEEAYEKPVILCLLFFFCFVCFL